MSNQILIIELTISLLGTGLMTIPIISHLRVLFEFGNLKQGKQLMRYDRHELGDIRFEEIASRYLETTNHANKVSTNEIDHITHEPNFSADIIDPDNADEPKFADSSTTDLMFVEYSINENNDFSFGSSYHEEIHEFYQLFEPNMRQGEQRIRVIGISLLGIGLFLQIASILI